MRVFSRNLGRLRASVRATPLATSTETVATNQRPTRIETGMLTPVIVDAMRIAQSASETITRTGTTSSVVVRSARCSSRL
jgi:hypothetical protein